MTPDLLAVLTEPLDRLYRTYAREVYEDALAATGDERHALTQALQDTAVIERLGDFEPDWWNDPHVCRWWLCVHVDWKAADEVGWQVAAAARTLNLHDAYRKSSVIGTVEDELDRAEAWFAARDVALVRVPTGGDDHLALIVPRANEARVRALLPPP